MAAYRQRVVISALIAILGGAMASTPLRADVTVQQQITMDAAGIVKMNATSVERTTSDKQRRDSEFRCEGFMSLLCGKTKSGQIVRLDRQLEWQLRPDKKSYLETAFPTPEERALAQQKLQETLDKMQQCQAQQPQTHAPTAPNTADCQLSSPKLDVKQTDEHAMLVGHDARKTSVTMSQTCTDKQSGDVCEMDYGFDVWLTTDDIPGIADQRAFTRAYLKAQGLDENNPNIRGAMQQFMAQYAGTMKELSAKASSLQGHPLRTTFSFSIGGEHCGRAKQAAGSSNSGSSGSSGGNGRGLSAMAADAIGDRLGSLGSLFSHKKPSPSADQSQSGSSSGALASTAAAGNSAAGSSAPQTVQIISFTTETTAIDTAPIPAEQFEIPGGWKRDEPTVAKNEQFTCPVAGK